MTLRVISKEKLMAKEPTHLRTIKNNAGQDVHFYEHPIYGDEHSVLAVIDEVAFDTDFYDLEDFKLHTGYMPTLVNGVPMCECDKDDNDAAN